MIALWNTFVYNPLYNVLMLLIEALPGHSVGVAIILLTIMVKILMLPLTAKSIRAQRAMKELEPEMKALQLKYKDDKPKLASATMELYKKRGVTPFSGCLPLLIQIPIIMALYFVFSEGLTEIDASILYEGVIPPAVLDKHFLLFDLGAKSVVLALLAGGTQFIQTHIAMSKQAVMPPKKEGEVATFQEDLARSMQVQMRYVLPVVVGVISYTLPSAVALYWATSNILSTVQELVTKRT